MTTQRHKVFVSYHHANDQWYRDQFEHLFTKINDIFVSKSVQIGDIAENLKTETIRQKIRDEYLRDTTVTVVLIGAETWKRKHVDWEISSSIRHTKYSNRSGLLGILLPSYHSHYNIEYRKYSHCSVPPRLSANLKNGYAKLYNWNNNPYLVQSWIHKAFEDRMNLIPINSYPSFSKNRTTNTWC